MVSIRATMDEMGLQERLLRKAVECYAAAVADVEKQTVQTCPESRIPAWDALRNLCRVLAQRPEEPAFDEARRQMAAGLADWSAQLQQRLAAGVELKEVLLTLEAAAQSVSDDGNRHVQQFRDIAAEINNAARLPSIGGIREKILSQARQLVDCVDEMHARNAARIERLQSEVEGYRHRLQDAERAATQDALTAAANRRGLASRVGQLTAAGEPFCLIVIDLNNFKQINDHFGHAAGDEVLRLFVERLHAGMRAGDFVARWGGDEFVVLLTCGLRDALIRVKQIQAQVCGMYALGKSFENKSVPVSASAGVADYRKGDTLEGLFQRADQLLYREKPQPR